MNEFIGWYKKRAEARYIRRHERFSAFVMVAADFQSVALVVNGPN
jgi:hypothetical protein